jgi:hypothetical protein
MRDTAREGTSVWWLVGYCWLAASLLAFAIVHHLRYP